MDTASPAQSKTRRDLRQAALGFSALALCLCCCLLAPAVAPAAPRAKAASSYSTNLGSAGAQHGGDQGASRGGSCANAQLRPSEANLALVRAATLCLVNRERTSRGEQPLRSNADLQRAAQAYSSAMASGDYFEHQGLDGSTPLSRVRRAGYISNSRIGYAVGENIAWGTLSLATPEAIVASWMASPGHRANILDATFAETGIGISPHPIASLARGEAGAIYTQDFGRIITR